VAQPFFKTPFLHNYMDLTRKSRFEYKESIFQVSHFMFGVFSYVLPLLLQRGQLGKLP